MLGCFVPEIENMSASLDDGECDVFLCNRPIQENGSGKSASSVLSFLTSSSRSVYGDSWNKHWLVLFYYGGDDVTICEATKDTAEDLTAMRYWKKRTSEEVTRLSKKHLGKHRVQESYLDKLVRKMSDCGKYDALNNNCQTWVLKLLKELGIPRPKEEYHAEEFVEGVILPLVNGFNRTPFRL